MVPCMAEKVLGEWGGFLCKLGQVVSVMVIVEDGRKGGVKSCVNFSLTMLQG